MNSFNECRTSNEKKAIHCIFQCQPTKGELGHCECKGSANNTELTWTKFLFEKKDLGSIATLDPGHYTKLQNCIYNEIFNVDIAECSLFGGNKKLVKPKCTFFRGKKLSREALGKPFPDIAFESFISYDRNSPPKPHLQTATRHREKTSRRKGKKRPEPTFSSAYVSTNTPISSTIPDRLEIPKETLTVLSSDDSQNLETTQISENAAIQPTFSSLDDLENQKATPTESSKNEKENEKTTPKVSSSSKQPTTTTTTTTQRPSQSTTFTITEIPEVLTTNVSETSGNSTVKVQMINSGKAFDSSIYMKRSDCILINVGTLTVFLLLLCVFGFILRCKKKKTKKRNVGLITTTQ